MANPINSIHTDDNVQHIDVRFYFDKDEDPEELLNKISHTIQNAPELCEMISAYRLKNDGFANLTPDSKPLA